MLKNKRSITVTVAGLTLIGNMAIATKSFADTVENKVSKNIESSVNKEHNKTHNIKSKRKKNHKGHNKNKKQLVQDKFEIIKAPIKEIDFKDDVNINVEPIVNVDGHPVKEEVSIDPAMNTYLDGKEVAEKLPEVNPSDFEVIKAPIRGIDFDTNTETLVDPAMNTYLDGKEVAEKLPEVNPSDFEIIKAPIRGIDFDTNTETLVDPAMNTYLDGKEVAEKLPEVSPFDFEIIKAPIRGVDFDTNTETLVGPATDIYLGGKEAEASNKEESDKLIEKLKEQSVKKESIYIGKDKDLQKESAKKISLNVMSNKQIEKLNDKAKQNKENKISEKNSNIELPKTATNNFTNILLGGILFIAGIAMSLFSKKRLHNK